MKERKPKKPRKLLPGEPEKWNCKSYRAYYKVLANFEKSAAFYGKMYVDINNAPYFTHPLPPLLTPERFAEARALLLQDRYEDMPQFQVLYDALLADLTACQDVVTAAVVARAAACDALHAASLSGGTAETSP